MLDDEEEEEGTGRGGGERAAAADVATLCFWAAEGLCCFSRAWTAKGGEEMAWVPGRVSMTITRLDLWWSRDELQLVLQASKV